jgi:VWFA-related protein
MFSTSKPAFLAISLLLICGVIRAQQPQPTTIPFSESIPYKPRLFQVKPDKKKKDKGEDVTATARPQPTEKMPGSGPAVKEDSPITIPVSVFDTQGNFVADLKTADFKVFIDGPEARVISVEHRTEPLNVFLIMDTSGSSAELLDSEKKLAAEIMDQFPIDEKISVFTFADELKELTPLTVDRDAAKNAIRKIDSKRHSGGTALYDITAELFERYVSALPNRTVVIFLTDGVDTTSRKMKYSEALVTAEKTGASVFPVYLDTFVSEPRPRVSGTNVASLPWDVQQVLNSPRFSVPGSSEAEYELGRLYLNDLVYLSGGRAIDAKSILEGKTKVATSISDELRQQYYLTFSPVGSAYIGQRKHLKIRVNRPNLVVIARGSYIVGAPPSKTASQ